VARNTSRKMTIPPTKVSADSSLKKSLSSRLRVDSSSRTVCDPAIVTTSELKAAK
jgi:hypothetical protein